MSINIVVYLTGYKHTQMNTIVSIDSDYLKVMKINHMYTRNIHKGHNS